MKTDIDEAIVTIHGASRLKERCKVKNSRSAEKNITRAFQRGKHATDCTSWEKAFLMKECHNDCTAIAYNGFCYVFNSNNVCVTLYPLPSWFGKKKHFHGKKRIRKFKKYCKVNTPYNERLATG